MKIIWRMLMRSISSLTVTMEKHWGFKVKARLYVNVVSNGEKITVIVRTTCSRPTIITAPMMIFTNKRHVYPI